MKTLGKMGVVIPKILLPKNIETETWSVVACDQYTQDREYWENVKKNVSNKPSTLNIILPEVYLNDADKSARIQKIKSTMSEYLLQNVFSSEKEECIYVERTTAYGRTRHGLVVAIDLENYEWKPFSTAKIRATEATIIERIPPRKEIRNGAPLESPHIMLLVNDKNHILVEAIGEKVKSSGKQPEYEGPLMQNSGSIKGYAVNTEEELSFVEKALEKIAEQNTQSDGSVFLFAVGDGNHSLATAKTVWNEYKEKLLSEGKSEEEIATSNVRYALVEIVNIYDTGLTFEPIHRVIFNANGNDLASYVQEKLGGHIVEVNSKEELSKKVKESNASFGFVFTDKTQKYLCLETPIKELAVSRLQPVLDDFVKANKNEIDYIHGTEEVYRLGAKENTVSVLLPPIAKDSFFETIGKTGPLPRKSFSMGEADEKRFYLECRKLF